MLKPYCNSTWCISKAGKSHTFSSGIEKTLDKIHDDICLDCNSSVFWKKKAKGARYIVKTRAHKKNMRHESWAI